MHIRKLPSGSWNIQAYAGKDNNGKLIRKSFTGSDLRALKAEAALWENEHKDTRDPKSVRNACQRYIKEREGILSPSTLQGYQVALKNLPPWLLRKPCHAISDQDIRRYIADAQIAPKSVQNRVCFLNAVLRNEGVKPPEVRRPQVGLPELNIPDSEDVKKMLQAADRELWICIMLAAVGSLRSGEISALRIEDISGNTVHVHRDKVLGRDNQWHEKLPKTRTADRYIEMPEEVITAIMEQGYVTKWTSKGIYNRFKTLLKKEGLPDCRFHDLRHFCVSELLSEGIEEIYVAERSGHAGYASMKRYTHALGNRRKAASEKILSHFEKTL